MKYSIILALTIFLSISSRAEAASEDLQCVQEQLNQLGFDAGPSDGLIGKRTVNASNQYVAKMKSNYPDWSMPQLSNETAALWCQKVSEANPNLASGAGYPSLAPQEVTQGLQDADCDFFTTPSRSTSVRNYNGFEAFPARLCVNGQRITEIVVWNKTNKDGSQLTTTITFMDGAPIPVGKTFMDMGSNIFEIGLAIGDVQKNCVIIKPARGLSVYSEAECFDVETN